MYKISSYHSQRKKAIKTNTQTKSDCRFAGIFAIIKGHIKSTENHSVNSFVNRWCDVRCETEYTNQIDYYARVTETAIE